MRRTSPALEKRVAALPISEAERTEALEYVRVGEELADAWLAIVHFFADHWTPTLRHTH